MNVFQEHIPLACGSDSMITVHDEKGERNPTFLRISKSAFLVPTIVAVDTEDVFNNTYLMDISW